MNRVWRTALALFVCSLIAAPLIGCATPSSRPYHGIFIENRTDAPILELHVEYGIFNRKYAQIRPRSGISSSQDILVPEIMTVSWRTPTSEQRKLEIPIRAKLGAEHYLTGIEISFTDDGLIVLERSNSRTQGDAEIKKRKIFP